ncbi:MAG: sigma-70 family RNA polymerase sigma factor [Phycisphaerae bacterium]
MDPNEELLNQAAAGDSEALASLLRTVGPQVRAGLRIDPRWQSVVDADDVMQVTYLEAFLQISRFQPDGLPAFTGWLRRIAENNLRDAARALERVKRPPADRRVNLPSPDESMAGLIEQLGVTTTTPSRQFGVAEAARAIDSALESLPDDYSRVVRLYDLEGRPAEEVASELGRSTGAMHMLRARAHDRLRDLLGSETGFFSRPA